MKKNKEILMFGILGILFGFALTMAIGSNEINNLFNKDYTPNQIPISEQQIIDNCKNLNLTEATYCIRDNVKLFYVYNKTIEGYSDIETLKKVGGDCLNWAKLYVKLADGLGFTDSELISPKNNGIKIHAIPLISNGQGYCIIDDLKVSCGEYK